MIYSRKCKNCFKQITSSELDSLKVFCNNECDLSFKKKEIHRNSFVKQKKKYGRYRFRLLGRKDKRKKIKHSDSFYETREWLEIRFKVLIKYGRECMCCGKTEGTMHVDHVKPRSKYPSLELDENNLQVLCKECNIGKSNKYDIDFRKKA